MQGTLLILAVVVVYSVAQNENDPKDFQCDIPKCPPGCSLEKEFDGPCPGCECKEPLVPACDLLETPKNGYVQYSWNEFAKEGIATVMCNPHHRLVGEETLVCMASGQWFGTLPLCEKLALCPDPGSVKNSPREIPHNSLHHGEEFLQDSKIYYKCIGGYEQMGTDTLVCQKDGKWSADLPFCVKVSTVVIDCFTKGSEIISSLGEPVRIICPPECVGVEFNVWGTSIYRAVSSVCQAAIHSAKITNSGGPVAVINTGQYSHFTGSSLNQVQSESYDDQDNSFWFSKLPPLSRSRNGEDCGKGLIKLEKNCAYISNNLRTYEEGKAVCLNLGLHLKIPDSNEDKIRLITELNSKGITAIWGEMKVSSEASSSPIEEKCPNVIYDHLEFKAERRNCIDIINFVCTKDPEEDALAICADPGPIWNGKAEAVGKIDDTFFVGSSIQYTCQPLHFLNGTSTISCMGNGSWSDPQPTCTKIDVCQDPSVPNGGFISYLKPYTTQAAQISAIHRPAYGIGPLGGRSARLPLGLSAVFLSNGTMATTTPEQQVVYLPPGFHRIGSRVMYNCDSKYYKLIGHPIRQCLGDGKWSGKPPTCSPICGISNAPRFPLITHGNATDVGQWPWQAGLVMYRKGQWILGCGASLLNERWLITAAHCVTVNLTSTVLRDADEFLVYLGKYYRQDSQDDNMVQVRKVQAIHIHPNYKPFSFDADIALIQLDSPVQLTDWVKPVCLPTEQTSRKNLIEGTRGVVTGWGENENQEYAEVLQQAVLPVVSNENCENGYEVSNLLVILTENMFCAGYEEGKSDSCIGDSGGPMVFLDTVDRKWVLEGVVNGGSSKGCGNPKQYGIYTTVSKFLDWINSVI